MALYFRSADTPLRDLQVWRAESDDFSFAISHENRSEPEYLGGARFIASWRRKDGNNTAAIALESSPFATLEEALQACERMLATLRLGEMTAAHGSAPPGGQAR